MLLLLTAYPKSCYGHARTAPREWLRGEERAVKLPFRPGTTDNRGATLDASARL